VSPGDKVKNIGKGRAAGEVGVVQQTTVNASGGQIVYVHVSLQDLWMDYARHDDVEKIWPLEDCELIHEAR
jgi:hypothetical protein